MSEKRGSRIHKLADRWLGSLLLLALDGLLVLKRSIFGTRPPRDDEVYLLICFGAIGDLIVLTQAVSAMLPDRQVYLACSKLNKGTAQIFDGVYRDVSEIILRDPLSVHKTCQRYGITTILDSTQWANIGPVQVGFAQLLGRDIETVGFETNSWLRNCLYCHVVPHGRHVHELVNFANLAHGSRVISSNDEIPTLLPTLYVQRPTRHTGSLLLHLWPSGNRSYLKAWPEAYWKELARYCIGLGYTVYLSGAPTDQEKSERFADSLKSDRVISLAGKYNLRDLYDFVAKQIEFAVSVNTGILHLVAAAGVPVIGLHGGVNPMRWGPLGPRSISLLPSSGKSAYLHYGFEYPREDRDAYVLDRLSVNQVIAAIESLRGDR